MIGTGEPGSSGDGGPARLARLRSPRALAFDSVGNLLIADSGNGRVRRMDTAGVITTLSAGLGDLQGLALDSRGNLYISTSITIRRIDSATGVITTVAGINTFDCSGIPDGTAPTSRNLCNVADLVLDPSGNLYFAHNQGVALLSASTGLITNFASTLFGRGLTRDGAGILFSAADGRVYRVGSSGGAITALAGSASPFDGPARRAILALPTDVGIDGAGYVYILERAGRRVRRLDPATGQITTLVGGGTLPLGADGLAATAVSLLDPVSLFVDPRGNIFFALSTALWKMDASTGKIFRLAGTGVSGSTGDGGPALQATFSYLSSTVVDGQGNVFLCDLNNNRVRRIDAVTGIINTVAGTGAAQDTGDGGPAALAGLLYPETLAFDPQGQLLISTSRLRRLNLSTGVITSVQARSREGAPLSNTPSATGLWFDRDGNIFLLKQSLMMRIRASDSLLETVAGGPYEGFFGDGGLATLARMSVAEGGLAGDVSGNIYFTDGNNGRVRKLTLTTPVPVLAVSQASLFFSQTQGSTFVTGQTLEIRSANSFALNWTLEIATSAGGGWLSAGSTSGAAPSSVLLTVDVSGLAAGTYRGTVTVRGTGASNSPQTVAVTLTVQPPTGPVLGLAQEYLTFQAVQGGANPAAQTLALTNLGSGTLNFSVTAETNNGGTWLRVSPASGSAPATLSVSAVTTALTAGLYQGRIVLRNLVSGETRLISAVLNVARVQPILLPTQTGFLFVGVEGSLVIGSQSFAIQNAGQGQMNWQIQVNLPGGGDWLRVSTLQGTSDASQIQTSPQVTLTVDPGRLRAGVSVALLTITAPGAPNSPQTAIVLVNVLTRGSPPVGTISPLGLIFRATAGATAALSQDLTVGSTGGQSLQFLARIQAGGNWLSVTPDQGVLISSSESAALTVQAQPAGLSPGVYFGSVSVIFGTGLTQEIAVALVAAPAGQESAAASGTFAAACVPQRLVMVETKLGTRFQSPVSWPIPLQTTVVDDCNAPVNTATVIAGFTSTDPPLPFQSLLRDGQYSATWVPVSSGQVGVTIRASGAGLQDGVVQISGAIGQGSALPLVFRDGWVNAASFDRFKPLAPGSIFSVFGSNLAQGKNLASETPLPRTLGNLRVSLGGIDVPLFYADSGQVNAQVPFELSNQRSASLLVSSAGSAGVPGTITLADSQPGIFTLSQSGSGQGAVTDAAGRPVDAANPAGAGGVVVIYATGLGMTNPAVDSGVAAPSPPLALARVTTPLVVTIGGKDAIVTFAGLAPNFVGLYQINAQIPAGLTASSATPLVITQNGVPSNTVTIAVR